MQGITERVPLTLAVAHYDRHVPFLDGTVGIEGVGLQVLEVGQTVPGRDGQNRHGQMLRDGAFDMAEVSLSSFLIARERDAPVVGVPVIPRRLFCQSLFYCLRDAPLRSLEDLAGKRIGLNTYQTTLSVLAKGDLEQEYGVPWQSVTWVINTEETFAFELPAGVKIERVPQGEAIDQLLLDGRVDAAILPHPPHAILANPERVRRVLPDARGAELAYFRKYGYWPIMHVLAVRVDVATRHPWLPRALYRGYQRARARAAEHWEDPNWSRLTWGRQYLEEEQALFGGDPWRDGVAANRPCLERFMGYSTEQGLIRAPLTMDALFHESVLDT